MADGKQRSIAVIAIHGVGDQAPGETARAIGDLLQDLPCGFDPNGEDLKESPPVCAEPGPEPPGYFPFRENALRINVRPVAVRPSGATGGKANAKAKRSRMRGAARGPFSAWVEGVLNKQLASDKIDAEIAFQFMDGKLRCYRGDRPDDTYSTIRLEGSRAKSVQTAQCKVDIYEAYWADLSRLKAGALSIFTELYQLLFHLSSLGVHCVNAAAVAAGKGKHGSGWRWACYRATQSWAAGLLSVAIPILNLLMFGVALAALGQGLLLDQSIALQEAIVSVVILLGIALLVGWLIWLKSTRKIRPLIWTAPPLLLALLAAVAIYEEFSATNSWPAEVLGVMAAVVSLALAGVAIWFLAQSYDRRRPNVLRWTVILALAGFAIAAASIWEVSPGSVPLLWTTRLFEVFDLGLWAAWALFFFAYWGTFIFGFVAIPETGTSAARSRWTGWLTLSVPTLSFLTVTTALWWAVAVVAKKGLPDIFYTAWIAQWHPSGPLSTLPDKFLAGPAEKSLATILGLALVAAVPAIWGLLPVVVQEVFPPETPKALDSDRSKRTGCWLDEAFIGLRVSGILLFVATGIVLPLLAALYLFLPGLLPESKIFGEMVSSAGIVSGGLFGALLAVRGQLRKAALGFRPVLDILLDVDNWLREHPLDANPTARICGRMVSLLRYVCNVRDDANELRYDALIIVAHSQGTVITADLLHYLQQQRDRTEGMCDPELSRIGNDNFPIWIYTMGCPLRQLYGLRFPDLYGWAYHEAGGELEWKMDDLVSAPAPNPQALGVKLWMNAYRSGDYIGRFLWRNQGCDYLWKPDSSGHSLPSGSRDSAHGLRSEFCIGAGAHTHYWDHTGQVIARELDRLIATIGYPSDDKSVRSRATSSHG